MVKLGNLILPDSIQWTNRYSHSSVAQESGRTLGGKHIVWSSKLSGGRPIDLAAEGDATWFSMDQVTASYDMAELVGAIFTLIFGTGTYQVMFRHQDRPAVSFTPILPHNTFFNGLIKLMEV